MFKRKLLVALLALVMVFAFMPFACFATDGAESEGVSDQITLQNTSAEEGDAEEAVEPSAEEETIASEQSDAEKGYELTVVSEEKAPLAATVVEGGDCCLLHLILIFLALVAMSIYVLDMKRRQERLFELEKELGEEEVDFLNHI